MGQLGIVTSPSAPKPRKGGRRKASANNGRDNGVKKIPQAHGGCLNAGGTPGNAGGLGAPPSELRRILRLKFAERVAVLEEIVADTKLRAGDRVKAIELLARYGLGTHDEVSVVSAEVQERLKRQAQLIAGRPTWNTDDLLTALDAVWA